MNNGNEKPKARALPRNEDGKILTQHHPQGIDESELFFNEERVFNLVLAYQQTKDVKIWQEIVTETIPLIDTIIRNYHFQAYDSIDALRSECAIKLSKVLMKFDPARGRCFSHFSVSFKHFLISYAQKVRNKTKRVTCVDNEILEQAEAKAYVPEDISEDFKARLYETETRFLETTHLDALKYLVTYFLLEGFGTSKTKLCHTLVATYDLTQERAYLLYDYALIKMRSVLYDFYTPHYNDIELLRLSKRWSLLPELAEMMGMDLFTRISHVFGGVTVTFPTPKDIARLKTEQNILERAQMGANPDELHELGTASGSNEGNAIFGRLGKAAMDGHHEINGLYAAELALQREYEALDQEDI
jgi:hypothetical protein